MSSVTLEQIEDMVKALPMQDQERLIGRLSEHLVSRQDYFARADSFIKTCVENPVRPQSYTVVDDFGMIDSGLEIAEMRDERGDQLL